MWQCTTLNLRSGQFPSIVTQILDGLWDCCGLCFPSCAFFLFKEPTRYVDVDEASGIEVFPESAQELTVSNPDIAESSAQLKKQQFEIVEKKPLKKFHSISYRITLLVCATMAPVAQFLLGVLETSITVVGPNLFGWSTIVVGLFLSAIASLVIPLSWVTSVLSATVEDRKLILFGLVNILVGFTFMADWSFINYTTYQFIVASILIFCGQSILDSVSYSLASKMVPSYATSGLFSKRNFLLLINFGLVVGRPLGPVWGAQSAEPSVGVFGVSILGMALSGVCLLLSIAFYTKLIRWG